MSARPTTGTTAPSASLSSPDAWPTSPSGRDVWRSARGPVLAGIALLLVAVVSVVVRGRAPAGYLEPDAASDTGSRALAVLLERRGVAIEPVSTVAAARRSARAAGPDTLLLVARSRLLPARQLASLAGAPGDRLLVEPTATALRTLAPGVTGAGKVPVRVRDPDCDLRAARLAGPASTGGRTYRVDRGTEGTAVRCYPDSGTPSLVRVRREGRSVTVAGTGAPFTNAKLDEQGNAALTVNLLGSYSSVVWLVPEPAAASPGTGGAGPRGLGPLLRLVPGVVWLAAIQLAVAVVLIALWRARRLGPVVSEPLPVVVRAAETTEGRARLYRSHSARDRAAEALRSGCRARLASRLGLGRDADPAALAAAVAARAGWPGSRVDELLYGSVPGDDAALVRLADDLDALETEVHRS